MGKFMNNWKLLFSRLARLLLAVENKGLSCKKDLSEKKHQAFRTRTCTY